MSVHAILRRKGFEVFTVAPSETAQRAAHVMVERNVAALVVTNGKEVVGLLTQRDLANALARLGAKLATLKVEQLMRRTFVTASPKESTKAIMALMTLNRATHIPVMDNEHLLGLISIGDVLKDRLDDLELEASVLRDAYIAAH